jgi:hypothetical protein
MNCSYCQGDEAIFWESDNNNAFIDSKGEMLVVNNGHEVRFNVQFCPMCARRFNVDKYTALKSGDDIWYVDHDNNEIEHGTICYISIKDGKVFSFSVDFDCGDFDEFDGRCLGKTFMLSENEAKNALITHS